MLGMSIIKKDYEELLRRPHDTACYGRILKGRTLIELNKLTVQQRRNLPRAEFLTLYGHLYPQMVIDHNNWVKEIEKNDKKIIQRYQNMMNKKQNVF